MDIVVLVAIGALAGVLVGLLIALKVWPNKFIGMTGNTGMPGPMGMQGNPGELIVFEQDKNYLMGEKDD